jgi:hypothetical protein
MTNDLDEERLGHHGPKARDRLRKLANEVGADSIDYSGQSAQSLSKSLAIKLAASSIGGLLREWQDDPAAHSEDFDDMVEGPARKVIENLLIGLGCEEVVEAWRKV